MNFVTHKSDHSQLGSVYFVNKTGTNLLEISFNWDCLKALCRVPLPCEENAALAVVLMLLICVLVTSESGPGTCIEVCRCSSVSPFPALKLQRSCIGIRWERPREFLT